MLERPKRNADGNAIDKGRRWKCSIEMNEPHRQRLYAVEKMLSRDFNFIFTTALDLLYVALIRPGNTHIVPAAIESLSSSVPVDSSQPLSIRESIRQMKRQLSVQKPNKSARKHPRIE